MSDFNEAARVAAGAAWLTLALVFLMLAIVVIAWPGYQPVLALLCGWGFGLFATLAYLDWNDSR